MGTDYNLSKEWPSKLGLKQVLEASVGSSARWPPLLAESLPAPAGSWCPGPLPGSPTSNPRHMRNILQRMASF